MTGVKDSSNAEVPLIDGDPWLRPYQDAIARRATSLRSREKALVASGSLREFSSGHEFFGLHKVGNEWVFRERAPNATRMYLVGDFNAWQETHTHRIYPLNDGTWELRLPLEALCHEQHYKLRIYWNESGREACGERIPSFARRVVQDHQTMIFSAQVWNPVTEYRWRLSSFVVPRQAPLIYEAHVGMAQEEAQVGTYLEFTEKVLPRIAAAGYNTIQLMAVQEHPYYGSFGYQVSNFFAPSSRFGTPEELMALVDTAHELGIAVIMDLVHSHAVKNEIEGLSRLDGSATLYFHDGPRGEHPAWNTRCFDYGKHETLHFLLSNCRYWLDAFHFDGYRFDGVTSMLYRDHGLGSVFTSYAQYFDGNVDEDALVYLSLANKIIHELRPDAITVAEEVSGMPGLAAPVDIGGCGFDYRLAMGIPDYWIKLIKHRKDEEWDVSGIWWELTNRRADEKTISYAESHDQALVGDKTIIFRLADAAMYWHMRKTDQNPVIDRAVALHKIIRLVTLATAGNGYLNFMGNEFGHPEWIDFPREGNNWSYAHARRQWSLRDDPLLRFEYLADFDSALVHLTRKTRLLEHMPIVKVYEHIADCVLAFERAGILFVINLHPDCSYVDRGIKVQAGRYGVVLDSDAEKFGGFGRVDHKVDYISKGPSPELKLYIPARTALVLERIT